MLIEQILQIDNFSKYSHTELMDIIDKLKDQVKYHMSSSHNQQLMVQTNIQQLHSRIDQLTYQIDKLKSANSNFSKLFIRNLTWSERITGKINLNINNKETTI